MRKSKRSLIYLTRHRGKSTTLFLLLFILGISISGAVSLQRAVQNTESNLHRTLPPLATMSIDTQKSVELDRAFIESGGTEEELRQWHIDNPQVVTDVMLRELADFPGVTSYDFSLSLFLQSTEVMTNNYFLNTSQVSVRGVTVSDFFVLASNAIEIIQGRSFLEEELNSGFTGMNPILVSEQIASANDLTLGSTFSLVNFVRDFQIANLEERYTPEYAILWDEHLFEVVGIFEESANNGDEDSTRFSQPHLELNNQFFIPAHIGYYLWHNQLQHLLQHFFEIGWWSEEDITMSLEHANPWETVLFMLESPEQLLAFEAFGNNLLPGPNIIRDLSFSYGNIITSVEITGDLLLGFFTFSMMAMLAIMILIILLYLRDRKQEYAIYLALGCKKSDIFWQTAIEIFVPSILALSLSLFIGNIIATEVSTAMMIEEFVHQQEQPNIGNAFRDLDGSIVQYHSLSYFMEWLAPEFGIDDMLEAFDTSVTPSGFLNFFFLSLAVIIGTSFLSFLYIIRINPKKLLEST